MNNPQIEIYDVASIKYERTIVKFLLAMTTRMPRAVEEYTSYVFGG